MKKIIIVIFCTMLLVGCSKAKSPLELLQEKYTEIESEVKSKVDSLPTILKDDYKNILNSLFEDIENISFDESVNKDEIIKKIYKAASYIENLASLFNGEASNELLKLSKNIKKLCEYAYGGSKEDFENVKVDVLKDIEKIGSWANEKWATIEKKDIIDWNDAKDYYQSIEEEIQESLKPREVTEIYLDELKHDILDNYEEISTGITKQNEDYAKTMYTAAYELFLYTEDLKNEEAKEVNDFAKATINYIKQNYQNSDIEEIIESQEYESYIEDATKWTQSLWNEITKYLKIS